MELGRHHKYHNAEGKSVSPHTHFKSEYFNRMHNEGLHAYRSPGGSVHHARHHGMPVCPPGEVISFHKNGNLVAPHCVKRAGISSPMPMEYTTTPSRFDYEFGERCRKGYSRSMKHDGSYGNCVKSKKSSYKKKSKKGKKSRK